MARRFRGEHSQKIDGKGRLSIPAGFRRVIELSDPDWVEGKPATLIIVYGNERRQFLECYTVEAINEIDEAIGRMPRGSDARRAMEDFIYAKSEEVQVDSSGRLVLPKKLRDKIGLSADEMVYYKAAGDTFQIWKEATYEAVHSANIDRVYDALPDGADPLIILDQFRES
ncbi:MAG: division/cell wall cluster transcriptional repressor MraZ [Rhodobacteraceae bacterium]|nr:division/cell wall cluster transcriptional repressor MraZ [Paracoccaceae bacterium]